jgi:hypothetical protein
MASASALGIHLSSWAVFEFVQALEMRVHRGLAFAMRERHHNCTVGNFFRQVTHTSVIDGDFGLRSRGMLVL